jgi:putative protein kinase ArgK-like GTPase of G3E family
VAIISVDPTRRKTGGALLGDRIRMNSLTDMRIYLRSLATRGSGMEISGGLLDVVNRGQGGGLQPGYGGDRRHRPGRRGGNRLLRSACM